MKQITKLLALFMIMIVILSGCGTIDNTGSGSSGTDDITGSGDNSAVDKTGSDNSSYTFEAEVIDAGKGLLVAPDSSSDVFRASDKVSVGTFETDITGSNGEKLTREELKAGDIIKITYNGIVAESYPAQITADRIEVTGHNILIDGYLALIDDIYQEDSGLNGDITMIALDTTGWSGLIDIEKEIIFSEMKKAYDLDIIEGTSDELSTKGIIDKDKAFFTDGILISLTNVNYNEQDKKITCGIKKWRSGDGAIGSDDVTAEYIDGEWKITKSGMWIS